MDKTLKPRLQQATQHRLRVGGDRKCTYLQIRSSRKRAAHLRQCLDNWVELATVPPVKLTALISTLPVPVLTMANLAELHTKGL